MRKVFQCIDAHTCGNPVRVVTGGGPFLEGNSMMEKRLHFLREYDWIRKGLMFEPRGHDMMSGCILYPPADPHNDVGVLYIETSGCLPMCGHGTIGVVTVMIEEGLVIPKKPGELRLEAPAGLVHVKYILEGKKVKSVTLTNVPSFCYARGWDVECPELGTLSFDIGYGGNFYAIIDPQENYSGLQDYSPDQLIAWSRVIRDRINATYEVYHPLDKNISRLSHIQWTGDPIHKNSDGRNAVFYGDKAIDRSPCGTGTSARMAQLYDKGLLPIGKEYVHESIIGSIFVGKIENAVDVGDYSGIIPSIQGWAKITGYNTIIIDEEDDPYAHGFQVL
jgi:4-hydroxyproline epimerase